MKAITSIIIIITIFFGCQSNTNKEPKKENQSIYHVVNTAYKTLLQNDSLPLNLYEHSLNPRFWASDTLLFDSLYFITAKYDYYTLIDTLFSWESDSLIRFNIITNEQTRNASEKDEVYFKNQFGKGFIIISVPLYDINGKYILIKERFYEDFSSEGNRRSLIFKKENNNWELLKIYNDR